jgi:hypothetical protein
MNKPALAEKQKVLRDQSLWANHKAVLVQVEHTARSPKGETVAYLTAPGELGLSTSVGIGSTIKQIPGDRKSLMTSGSLAIATLTSMNHNTSYIGVHLLKTQNDFNTFGMEVATVLDHGKTALYIDMYKDSFGADDTKDGREMARLTEVHDKAALGMDFVAPKDDRTFVTRQKSTDQAAQAKAGPTTSAKAKAKKPKKNKSREPKSAEPKKKAGDKRTRDATPPLKEGSGSSQKHPRTRREEGASKMPERSSASNSQEELEKKLQRMANDLAKIKGQISGDKKEEQQNLYKRSVCLAAEDDDAGKRGRSDLLRSRSVERSGGAKHSSARRDTSGSTRPRDPRPYRGQRDLSKGKTDERSRHDRDRNRDRSHSARRRSRSRDSRRSDGAEEIRRKQAELDALMRKHGRK